MHCQKFFRIGTLYLKNVNITQHYLKHSEYDSYLQLCIWLKAYEMCGDMQSEWREIDMLT